MSTENTTATTKRGTRFQRHRVARIMAIQAIYEANHSKQDYQIITDRFLTYNFYNHTHPVVPEKELFIHVLNALEANKASIELVITNSTVQGWQLKDIDPIVISILQAALAELKQHYNQTAVSIIISEYIEICKGFCETKEANYVHKVLDNYIASL